MSKDEVPDSDNDQDAKHDNGTPIHTVCIDIFDDGKRQNGALKERPKDGNAVDDAAKESIAQGKGTRLELNVGVVPEDLSANDGNHVGQVHSQGS